MRPLQYAAIFLLVAVMVPAGADITIGSDGLGRRSSWQYPAVQEVRAATFDWLAKQRADDHVRKQADVIWQDAGDLARPDLLEKAIATFALTDQRIRQLAAILSAQAVPARLPDLVWLDDPKTAAFVRNNVRLCYARWLAQQRFYDECLASLKGLGTSDVVDPGALLFYASVAHHHLLQTDEGLEKLYQLLENESRLPRRFVVLARLMIRDLEKLKKDSLDHISRRARDVERRLDFGRTDKKVRDLEDGIIKSLDKLIKKLEKMRDEMEAAMASVENIQSSSPAQESMPMGGKGPGRVTKKDIGSTPGWGDLPPKEREQALQGIGRDFPPHYRNVVEEYFRELSKLKAPEE